MIERSKSSGDPDKFAQVIGESLRGDTDHFALLGKELTGFHGEMASEIEKWQREGLGRALGVPLITGNVYGQAVDTSGYRGVLYSLSLTDDTATGHDMRTLLIFPHKQYADMAIIRPRKSIKHDPESKEFENSLYIGAFTDLFSANDNPYIHPSWRPAVGKKSYSSFAKDPHAFAECIGKIEEVSRIDRISVIKTAVTTARLNKNKKIYVDDASLLKLLGTDVTSELEVLNGDWEQYRKQWRAEEAQRITELFHSSDSTDRDAA